MFKMKDKEINTLIYNPLILIEQDKKSDDDDDKEEQHTPKLPPGVPKMMGGLVLGGSNMMAELKAKQEKRKSMVKLILFVWFLIQWNPFIINVQ